jgi:hypothetical protein
MNINKPKIGINILKVDYDSGIVLFFLLFARQGWGAVYYVDNTAPDTHVAGVLPDFTTYDHMTFSITGGSGLGRLNFHKIFSRFLDLIERI